MDVNKCIFSGRLTRDPEIREVGDSSVARFRILSNRIYYKGKGKDKEKCEDVTGLDVEVWGAKTKIVEYLSKGDYCIVEGSLKEDNWTDRDGNKRYNKTLRLDELYLPPKNVSGSKSPKKKEEASEPVVEENEENEGMEESEEIPF